MEQYLALVGNPAAFKKIKVPTGQCNGRLKISIPDENPPANNEPEGHDYAEEYRKQEDARYENAAMSQTAGGALSMVSGITGLQLHDPESESPRTRTETTKRIFNDYVFIKPTRDELPIDSKKHDILCILQLTNIIIIQGDTGCGKTTQVPQFILDDCKERKEYCNIAVTQPRKLAAISVAKHVSAERGWECGTLVGYHVGLDRHTCPDTILTYMTAGLLLQKIINRKDLNEFTHIIIDEVHERTQEMDFLLILIRRFMNTNSMGVKIILMSATFDTEKFADYFKTISGGTSIPATRLDVNKQMMFDKSIHYLEELSNLGDVYQDYDIDEPNIPRSVYDIFVQLVLNLKHVDNFPTIGHVLVFLPGIYEIELAYNLLMAERDANFMIVPLHSSIPGHEQGRVFAKPPPGVRKIILSTNIAESSITVPDIVYVIDFCMTKTLVVNPLTQYQTLRLMYASKTNCIQRAGRVGRVCPGRVYRLVTRDFYDHYIPLDIVPEMVRVPLERIVLMSKKLDLAELPQSLLALALDPPELGKIKASIKNLKEIGGLLSTCRGEIIEADGDVTMLGKLMMNLPIDVKLSKLIGLGYLFSCLDECIIMAAGCSLQNIFSAPFKGDRLNAYVNKLTWADGSCSDLIAQLKLYQTYQNNKSTGVLKNIQEEKHWCAINYLSYRSMKDWEVLVHELKDRLDDMNIRPPLGAQHVQLRDTERSIMLKVCIAGAFYPNYFSRSCDAGQVDEVQVCKILQGLDQNSTVYFTNMALNQPGPLYEQRVKEIMKPISDDINVYFDKGSKVFVKFNQKRKPITMDVDGRKYVAHMPGQVNMNVYKSVKMRQLRYKTTFPVMQQAEAWELATKLNLASGVNGFHTLLDKPVKNNKVGVLPGLKDNLIKIIVSHAIDAGHFFAQRSTQSCVQNLEKIRQCLNNASQPLNMVDKNKINLGDLYASKFAEDGLYYRCCVLGIIPFGRNDIRVNIIYIDYGNTDRVPPNDLFAIPAGPAKDLPAQAMECTLCGVKPVATFNPLGTWPESANNLFYAKTDGVVFGAAVYSVVNNVVSVELVHPNENISINQMLVDKGFGEKQEEPYISRENHELRQQAMKSSNSSTDGAIGENGINKVLSRAAVQVDAPRATDCRSQIELKGPFSPLEMKMYSMSKSSAAEVRIEQDSINCVLLDFEPQDPHERMLVATHIGKGQYNESLTLRHTTMMPNARGLPAIIVMLFAPKILMKANCYGNSYASVLCGLGVDKNNKSIFPEHDFKVVFDVDITPEDLTMVNEVRYIMNRIMDTMDLHIKNSNVQPHTYHRSLKDRLFALLTKPHESKEREIVKYDTSWISNEYEGNPMAPDASYRKAEDIWPLHVAVELLDKNDDKIFWLKHIDELSSYVRRYKNFPETVRCHFCELEFITLTCLRGHVVSPVHKTNVHQFLGEIDN